MTIFKLGYVAMSENLKNASPSQTMTYKQFSQIANREAALRKLERIAISNLENCLRLLKHNTGNEIHFFRFSSKLIPLANHPELQGWNFMRPLKSKLSELGEWVEKYSMRVDFHPDHFVVINNPHADILKASLKTLSVHEGLLKGMNIDTAHRCVLHVGGAHNDKEGALEQFIVNWGFVPEKLQRMIILENDDTTFNIDDTLYLCEKLGIPFVFDLHHHLANYTDINWEEQWSRIMATWKDSPLPLKMHISSPRSETEFRAHADYIDVNMFMGFLETVNHTLPEIHCMIEAKAKDNALFQLAKDLRESGRAEFIDRSTFTLKNNS